jgi:hypothetical protein
LKKAGLNNQTPLALDVVEPGGWVRLAAGSGQAATLVASIAGAAAPLVVSVLVGGADAAV